MYVSANGMYICKWMNIDMYLCISMRALCMHGLLCWLLLIMGLQSFFSLIMLFCLQILLAVLDATPFPFSIKLAAIASGKDQINLEKWLTEHLSTYKDAFCEVMQMSHSFLLRLFKILCKYECSNVPMTGCISSSQDCFKFLKEVLSNEANDGTDSSVQQHQAAVLNVCQETCSTFFKVLQNS